MNRAPLRCRLLFIPLALALMGGVLERSTNAAFPGQNGKIAFQSSRFGNFAIFVVNPDGSGLAALTFGLANDGAPNWSADGSKIVRKKGIAFFKYGNRVGGADVIFGQKGDSLLLGALTLEALGLALDPLQRSLKPLPMILGGLPPARSRSR